MPQGYYTVEQWAPPEWIAILHLPFGRTLTDAEDAIQKLAKPGLYRVVQMQRVIWAEDGGTGLTLRKSHASSPENLDQIRRMFERCRGQYPRDEVRAARRQAKLKRRER